MIFKERSRNETDNKKQKASKVSGGNEGHVMGNFGFLPYKGRGKEGSNVLPFTKKNFSQSFLTQHWKGKFLAFSWECPCEEEKHYVLPPLSALLGSGIWGIEQDSDPDMEKDNFRRIIFTLALPKYPLYFFYNTKTVKSTS